MPRTGHGRQTFKSAASKGGRTVVPGDVVEWSGWLSGSWVDFRGEIVEIIRSRYNGRSPALVIDRGERDFSIIEAHMVTKSD